MDEALLWSMTGPVCCVIALSMLVFIAATFVLCQGRSKHADADMSYLRYDLRVDFIYLPLQSLAWLFALLTVNYSSVAAFHFLFLTFTCLQAAFIVVAFIALSRETKLHWQYSWYKRNGRKDEDDRRHITRSSHRSARSLSAHSVDSGLDIVGGHTFGSKPCSPNQSTKKTENSRSHNAEKQKRGMPSSSSSSSSKGLMSAGPDQPVGISAFHDSHRRQQSDSDSEASAAEAGDIVELASSHSSDDDDDAAVYSGWKKTKRNGAHSTESSSKHPTCTVGRLPTAPSRVSSGSPRNRRMPLRVVTHEDSTSSASESFV